ncbi:hypothetical protein OSTOST_14960 [Ostertagia ostertagi]
MLKVAFGERGVMVLHDKKKRRKKKSKDKSSDSGTTHGLTKPEKAPDQDKQSRSKSDQGLPHDIAKQIKKSKESRSKSESGKGQEKGKPLTIQQLAPNNIFPFSMAELERQQVKEFNMFIDKLAMKDKKPGKSPSSLASTLI